MKAEELIERYVHEVGNELPPGGRADIKQELQSLLEDELEARIGEGETKVATAVALLEEFGPPARMAAQYRGERHLIGPRLFPLFRVVVTITLTVMTVFHVLILALVIWQGRGTDLLMEVWGWFTDYAGSAVTVVGIITLVFAGVEYFYGDEIDLEEVEETWDPLSLPPVNDPDRISRGEEVLGVALTAVFLSIFVALVAVEGALAWLIDPLFRQVLFLLILSSIFDLVIKGIVIWQGRWRTLTRLLEIAAELFGLFVLYLIVTATAITTIPGLDIAIRLGIAVAIIVTAINIAVKVAQLLWRRRMRIPVWRAAFKG